jgi:MoaA/NifB/PqqE/SkfB family radical SAM enzyme
LRLAFLILTTQCNRRCPYCFYETEHQDRGDTSQVLNVDRRLLAALRSAGIGRLILTGGEPLLLTGLEETVRRSVEGGFDTLLLTNGDRLDAGRLERLTSAGLSGISLSLDALSAGAESKAPWEVLRRIAAHGRLRAAVISPLTRLNLASMPEIMTRIHALGLYLLLQPVYVPRDGPLFERYSLGACSGPERDQFEAVLDLWERLYGESAYADLIRGFYQDPATARPPGCTMGTMTVVIDPDGGAMPCFHRRDLLAGNVLAGDPAVVLERCFKHGTRLADAPCFGEHCISLFSHL